MLNFEQLDKKISDRGFRRRTTAKDIFDETTGKAVKVYDYEHRKKYDMFSVYTDEDKRVLYAEYTKVTPDYSTRKLRQEVIKLTNTMDINKVLA
jgi:hypothetical protein